MRKIFTIGETVLDILFKEYEPVAAKAGGACLNSAISLGRLGMDVNFVGEYGLDHVGNFIDKFLKLNNINTEFIYRYVDGKSTLALAFLNHNNDASYDFYRIPPISRVGFDYPEIGADDILLFGSIYSISLDVRKNLVNILQRARENKAIIIYDPNFRKSHLHQLKTIRPLIDENIAMADIVRGSDEDFSLIYGTENVDETFNLFKDKNKVLLYTANKKGVYLKSKTLNEIFPVDQITPVSTIGAGDNFNAGIIYSIFTNGIKHKELSKLGKDDWQEIVATGVRFATHVCMSYENYISMEFAHDITEGDI